MAESQEERLDSESLPLSADGQIRRPHGWYSKGDTSSRLGVGLSRQVKFSPGKLGDLSSIPRTRVKVEGENQPHMKLIHNSSLQLINHC